MTCQAAQASGNAPLSGASEKTNEEIFIDTIREKISGETTFVEAAKKITSSTPEELDALLYSSSNPGGNPSQNPAVPSVSRSANPVVTIPAAPKRKDTQKGPAAPKKGARFSFN